ncbi:hypothetical protein E2C01_072059 [Portunus trituberculatus]|uniref:Uncharacterized protein n=1 Tax=Portunus trituberculatus TaxID=210409 RepID=A0A5B7HX09_PORTR|nr:hypothetical protein [Portunus trituberculatus]
MSGTSNSEICLVATLSALDSLFIIRPALLCLVLPVLTTPSQAFLSCRNCNEYPADHRAGRFLIDANVHGGFRSKNMSGTS